MKKVIAITTGGTGGHYFPAKALCDTLLKDNYEVIVFLDKRAYKYKYIWDKRVTIKQISSLGFKNKSILHIIKMLFMLGVGILQSIYYFLKYKPKATVSFGGYSSIPAVFSSILLRIPVVMHEQNATLGKAHKLLLRFSKALAVTFKDIKKVPSSLPMHVVGIPVRKEFLFFRNKKKEYESNDKFVFCILGGSLGAKIFSDLIPEAFAMISEEEQKNIKVYHQCREESLKVTKKKWEATKVDVDIKPFFNNIPQILWETDLVIGRSGSSSIAEINTIGRYAIYIPYALATDNHQELNAIHARDFSGADYIKEKDFKLDSLLNIINEALSNPKKVRDKGLLARQSATVDSTDRLKKIVEEVMLK